MWRGLQTIIDYKGKPRHELPSDTSLPDRLNAFYACFEASNTEACMRAPAVPDDCVIMLSVAKVSKTFKQRSNRWITRMCTLSMRGPTGKCLHWHFQPLPDRVCNTYISSRPPFQAVPVPKKEKVTCPNDYCPVALTPVAMKCFERLVMAHINSILPDNLDPLQFAYRSSEVASLGTGAVVVLVPPVYSLVILIVFLLLLFILAYLVNILFFLNCTVG